MEKSSSVYQPHCPNCQLNMLSATWEQVSGQWVPPTHSPRALSFFSLGFFLGNGNCFGPGLQLPSDFNFCNFIIIFRYFVWPNTPNTASPFLIQQVVENCFSVYNFIFQPLSMIESVNWKLNRKPMSIFLVVSHIFFSRVYTMS